ncbi:MAG: leucine-rich repeat protein [Clostridia bacterium]|nr:leucine-rich repeat protein [Clostridia bacterium]
MRNNKKLLSLILTLVIVLSALPLSGISVFAAEVSGICGDDLVWTLDSVGVLTVSGTGDMYDYDLSDSPFQSNGFNIKSLVIEPGVTSIGDYAFSCCYFIDGVVLPNGVKRIGDNAFDACGNLNSISIPDTVTDIGDNSFYQTALYNNEANWDNGVLYINNHLISGAKIQGSSYEIKAGTVCIADYAFSHSYGIKKVTIPNSVITIGESAFEWCTSLCEVEIGNNVVTVGDYAFACCYNIESITLPDTLVGIGNYAFEQCRAIKMLYLGKNVQRIGNSAFYNCVAVGELELPDSLTYIGVSAFEKCSSFKEVVVPESIGIISDKTFASCTSLESVTLGNNITAIGKSAFSKCYELVNINFPAALTEIDDYAFYFCGKLKNASLPDAVTQIGVSAFESCGSIEALTLGANIKNIGESAFNRCGLISSVNIPSGAYSVGDYAFADCSNLAFVTVHDSAVGDNTFKNCPLLTIITCADSPADIYAKANSIPVEYFCRECVFTQYTSNNDGNCTEDGTMTAYCDNGCGKTNTITEPDSRRHDYKLEIITEPTCFAEGEGAYICTLCSYSYNDTLSTVDHKYEKYVSNNDATCGTDGTKTAYCKFGCGATDTVTDEGSSDYVKHVYSEQIVEKEASCTETGLTRYICECGEFYLDSVPVKEHDYKLNVTLEPTCSTEGEGTYVCTVCAYSYNAVIPTADHKYENYISNNDATCKADGTKTAYCEFGCGNSNTIEDKGSSADAKHVYNEEVVEESSCTKDGTICYTCECGDSYTDSVPAKGHTPGDWVVTKEATLQSEGEKVKYCNVCNQELENEIIPKLVPSIKFSDVPDDAWYAEGVNYCAGKGYITGVGNNMFNPDGKLTREQFVVILARVAGANLSLYTETVFSDVDASSWYGPSVIWSNEMGYVNGIGNGKFGVGMDINRESLATLFYRYADKNGIDTTEKADLSDYSDVESISSWSKDACEWAVGAKLLSSTNANILTLSPQMTVTRAQAAKIFMSYDQIK